MVCGNRRTVFCQPTGGAYRGVLFLEEETSEDYDMIIHRLFVSSCALVPVTVLKFFLTHDGDELNERVLI